MMVLGAAISLVTMWLIYTLSRGGMGDGDVRLAPLLGMYLGWLNPGIVLPGLFFGFIAGAVVGVAMMFVDRAGRRTAVPFGPFLAVGTIVRDLRGSAFHRPRPRTLTGVAGQTSSFRPPSTPYIAETSATATKPTIRPTNTIMIGSNIVVNFLMRLSSSRSK